MPCTRPKRGNVIIGILSLSLCLCVAARATGADHKPQKPASFPYQTRAIEGFTVYINNEVLRQKKNDEWKYQALTVLASELKLVVSVMPPKALKLVHGIKVWVEWDDPDPKMPSWVAAYYGGAAPWLLAEGKDPRKANCIVILSLRRLTEDRQPKPGHEKTPRQSIVLHELAHAIHFDLFARNNSAVKDAYRQAMERRLYDEVEYFDGGKRPAYARINQNEYFAELSCAYLRRCDYFPHTRDELRTHDPVGYRLMESVWGKPAK